MFLTGLSKTEFLILFVPESLCKLKVIVQEYVVDGIKLFRKYQAEKIENDETFTSEFIQAFTPMFELKINRFLF